MWSNKKNKFGNKKIEIDGHKFASSLEAEYYQLLKFLERSQTKPHTQLLSLQPHVHLTKAKILYKPDFHIKENGEDIMIEVKGHETATYRLKRRLYKHYGKYPLRVIKKNRNGFYVSETVNPIGVNDDES